MEELMPSLTLRPSKAQTLRILPIGAVCAGGAFLILPSLKGIILWGMWSCLAVFGLGLFISVLRVIPGSTYVRLSREGFVLCTLWRKFHYRWADVSGFGVLNIGPAGTHQLVGFNFNPGYEAREHRAKLKQMNVSKWGYEASLADLYGMKAEALAALLNDWRQRFGDVVC
ncbi:MAG: hypothetical protein JWO94_3402 [Verrucomicrobiaceae bacterium]|nr:hypothetical protein [Verrucomicrobiaceae bacterium]